MSRLTPKIVILNPSHSDRNGVIINILELAESDEPIRGVSFIHSVPGAERSNHYHQADSHWLYVLSGEMHYQERPIGSTDYPETLIVRAGQMVFTPPMVEHRTTFPRETMMLSLSRFARDAGSHEKDLVRVNQ